MGIYLGRNLNWRFSKGKGKELENGVWILKQHALGLGFGFGSGVYVQYSHLILRLPTLLSDNQLHNLQMTRLGRQCCHKFTTSPKPYGCII
jgi:hypothetical protein